jgi:hypothetical protein
MELKDEYYIANNAEELLLALKKNEPYIIIRGDYKKEFEENTQLPLTENEIMGFELGFRGWGGILAEVFFQMINLFGKGSKQQKKIDSRIRKYIVKKRNEEEILLYLRRFDY